MRPLFIILIFLLSFGEKTSAHPCDRYLVENSRLGIGVLGRTLFGFPVLGIGSYLGAQHERVLERMRARYALAQIEWMGEFRYRMANEDIEIWEANETSGYFASATSPLPMLNDSRHIPLRWQAQDFTALHFDSSRPHLDPTLNAVTGNVRHELINALAKFSAVATITATNRPVRDLYLMIEDFNSDPTAPAHLVMWTIQHAIRYKMIEPYEVKESLRAARLLRSPELYIKFIESIDVDNLQDEIQLLSQAVHGRDRFDQVKILAGYWPF